MAGRGIGTAFGELTGSGQPKPSKESKLIAKLKDDPSVGPRTASQILAARRDEVHDAEGRRRFHGAFTGGFSAGYFNTVGSKEGWAPTTFTSSRGSRQQVVQRATDFMDEEDDALLGGVLQAKQDFDFAGQRTQGSGSRLGSAVQAIAGMGSSSNASAVSAGVIMGPALPSNALAALMQPASIPIGWLILRSYGWREGQQLGPLFRRGLTGSGAGAPSGAGVTASEGEWGLLTELWNTALKGLQVDKGSLSGGHFLLKTAGLGFQEAEHAERSNAFMASSSSSSSSNFNSHGAPSSYGWSDRLSGSKRGREAVEALSYQQDSSRRLLMPAAGELQQHSVWGKLAGKKSQQQEAENEDSDDEGAAAASFGDQRQQKRQHMEQKQHLLLGNRGSHGEGQEVGRHAELELDEDDDEGEGLALGPGLRRGAAGSRGATRRQPKLLALMAEEEEEDGEDQLRVGGGSSRNRRSQRGETRLLADREPDSSAHSKESRPEGWLPGFQKASVPDLPFSQLCKQLNKPIEEQLQRLQLQQGGRAVLKPHDPQPDLQLLQQLMQELRVERLEQAVQAAAEAAADALLRDRGGREQQPAAAGPTPTSAPPAAVAVTAVSQRSQPEAQPQQPDWVQRLSRTLQFKSSGAVILQDPGSSSGSDAAPAGGTAASSSSSSQSSSSAPSSSAPGMAGKQYRLERRWQPSKLLCKRFNVADPVSAEERKALEQAEQEKAQAAVDLALGIKPMPMSSGSGGSGDAGAAAGAAAYATGGVEWPAYEANAEQQGFMRQQAVQESQYIFAPLGIMPLATLQQQQQQQLQQQQWQHWQQQQPAYPHLPPHFPSHQHAYPPPFTHPSYAYSSYPPLPPAPFAPAPPLPAAVYPAHHSFLQTPFPNVQAAAPAAAPAAAAFHPHHAHPLSQSAQQSFPPQSLPPHSSPTTDVQALLMGAIQAGPAAGGGMQSGPPLSGSPDSAAAPAPAKARVSRWGTVAAAAPAAPTAAAPPPLPSLAAPYSMPVPAALQPERLRSVLASIFGDAD